MSSALRRVEAIHVGFERERLFIERPDVGLIVLSDHDDSALADRVSPRILGGVVADPRPARYEDVAIDDRVADASVAPDPDPRHEDALLNLAEAVHTDVGPKHAARDV